MADSLGRLRITASCGRKEVLNPLRQFLNRHTFYQIKMS